MAIRVRATARGYYGDLLREPGDEFLYEGYRARWLEPVDGAWPAGSEKPEPVVSPTSRLGLREAAGAIAEAAVAELARQNKTAAAAARAAAPAPVVEAPAPPAAPAGPAEPVHTEAAPIDGKAERKALIEQAAKLGVKKPGFMKTDALKAAIAAAGA